MELSIKLDSQIDANVEANSDFCHEICYGQSAKEDGDMSARCRN
jgi:hypothetical protein